MSDLFRAMATLLTQDPRVRGFIVAEDVWDFVRNAVPRGDVDPASLLVSFNVPGIRIQMSRGLGSGVVLPIDHDGMVLGVPVVRKS